MHQEIGVGLLGLGNVGGSFLFLLEKNRVLAEGKAGARFTIKKILVRDLAKPRPVRLSSNLLTTKAEEVLRNREIDVVIETMGGTSPAKEYILEALGQGKDVVTANKEVLALHGREIFQKAAAFGRQVLFEASVGGAIPIIRPLAESLAGNQICRISGILNGTTNYILTRMGEEGLELETALRLAQEKGFSETDPSDDLEGRDAARKLAILASLAYNTVITPEDIHTEGIGHLEHRDLALTRRLGYSLKLLAQVIRRDDALELSVQPTLLGRRNPLAQVNDSFNAILVEGDASGETMFYGQGAGGLATASSLLGDLIEVARLRPLRQPRLTFGRNGTYRILPSGSLPNPLFLRIGVPAGHGPGDMGALFYRRGIEVRTFFLDADEAVVITGAALAAQVRAALSEEKAAVLRQILRVEEEGSAGTGLTGEGKERDLPSGVPRGAEGRASDARRH